MVVYNMKVKTPDDKRRKRRRLVAWQVHEWRVAEWLMRISLQDSWKSTTLSSLNSLASSSSAAAAATHHCSSRHLRSHPSSARPVSLHSHTSDLYHYHPGSTATAG